MATVIEFPANRDNSGSPEAKLGSDQASPTGDIIKRAQAVLDRLECNLSWSTDWCVLILALGSGRDLALRTAETNRSQGPKYRAAMGAWLRCYGFDRIDEADRSRLIQCFDNLAAIDAWRAKLPAEKQKAFNHPRTVLAHWKRSLRPASPGSSDNSPKPTPSITADAVITWLATTANQEDKRRVAAALAADVQAVKKILPGKQLPAKATNKQVFERAMGLMVSNTIEGTPQ
jgi:hypothetical protein